MKENIVLKEIIKFVENYPHTNLNEQIIIRYENGIEVIMPFKDMLEIYNRYGR